jgi:hypothetical protein
MKTPSDPNGGAKQLQDCCYEICWHIFRFSKENPSVKMVGTNCPCRYNPEENKHCLSYEPVKIKET